MLRRIEYSLAIFIIGVAGYVCLSSFISLGKQVSPSLVLTGYRFDFSSGQEVAVGFSGETAALRADVLLQGREMADVIFRLSHDGPNRFSIIAVGGDFDSVVVDRRRFGFFVTHAVLKPGERSDVEDGTQITSRGVLARAAFRLRIESPTIAVLELASPLYRDIPSTTSRLSVDTTFRPVLSAALDETYFRTRSQAASYRVWPDTCGLHLQPEKDWASSANLSQPDQCLPAGQPVPMGNLVLTYRNPIGSSFFGLNHAQLFGVRVLLAVILSGVAFLLLSGVEVPHGSILFAASALLMTVGLVLQARDFFLLPHSARFLITLNVAYWSAFALFCLTLPLQERTPIRPTGYLAGFAIWLVIHFLLADKLDGGSVPFRWMALDLVKQAVKLALVGFAINIALGVCRSILAWWTEAASQAAASRLAFRVGLGVMLLPILLLWLSGGSEAITVPGFRIYLPTILIPLTAITVAMLAWSREPESDDANRTAFFVAAVLPSASALIAYWLLSRDNGGTALIAMTLLISLWIVSTNKLIMTVVSGLALVVLVTAAVMSRTDRFALAWGSSSERVLLYDQAQNLRTARDLARAGGPFGRGVDLIIPSTIRGNIGNDLVSAYIAGYFGWVGVGVVIGTLMLTYYCLLAGLNPGAGPRDARDALRASAFAIASVACIQAAWVFAAPLQHYVPLTGQDLQPISASTIAVLSFFVVILGSAVAAHNVCSVSEE